METQPGSKTLFRLPDGEAKAMHMINDSEGNSCLIIFVDFSAYISKYPFENYKKLEI